MTVADQVKDDLSAAMKAGDRDRVGALRLVLSELQKAAKEGGADEQAVLRRERKRRLDAARQFRDAEREELASGEEREAALIEGYLPAQLDDSELERIVAAAISESGATSVQEMGRVVGLAMAKVEGRADGGRVSTKVRESLGA